MIPKVIHYCWFGKGKKGELIEDCIKSWKKYCPEYEIIEWNEENFDINSNKFVKEAYETKKWAFVTDYVRLFALYNYGGVYMDTDVELLKPISSFLENCAFSGFETIEKIPTAIMGAEKGNEWIKYLLSYYDNRSFFTEDGKLDTKTNVEIISEMTKEKYNIELNGNMQEVPKVFKLYPKDYFCPKDYSTGLIELTDNTVCIHHFNASWFSKIDKKMNNKRVNYIKKYGKGIGEKKYASWSKRAKLEIHIKKYGLKAVIKNIIKKIVCFFGKFIYGNNVILLESLNGLDGNSGAIYDYMIANDIFNNYKFVWFVRKKKSYHKTKDKRTYIYEFEDNSLKKKVLHNIAKVILYDNMPIERKNNNQKIIYLTHGTPTLKNVKGIINVPEYVDYAISTSKDMVDIMSYQFSIEKSKMVVAGLPRNDYLFKKDKNICSLFEKDKYNKVIIWLPTFRKSAYDERNDSNKQFKLGIPLIESDEELEELNKKLEGNNVLLIIKTHPGQDNSIIKLKPMSNILFVTDDKIRNLGINLYSVLGQTDALLTDYSTVAFDYMLLDKPIGYIIDDIKEYKLGFTFDEIYKMMPGNKIETVREVYNFIDDILQDKDTYKKERREILAMTNEYKDNKNCERAIELFNL